MSLPTKHIRGNFRNKSAGFLTAAALFVAAIGVPLPLPVANQVGELFPCMNRGCGCTSAETCWRGCCCFSNAEKVAWARRHGVEVPGYVLEQLAAEPVGVEDAELASMKPCCRRRVMAARTAARCDKPDPGKQAAEVDPVVRGVLAIHALKCQGKSLTLSLLPPTVPADEIGTDLPLSPREQTVLAQKLLYQPPSFDAVVPPPEFATLSPLT